MQFVFLGIEVGDNEHIHNVVHACPGSWREVSNWPTLSQTLELQCAQASSNGYESTSEDLEVVLDAASVALKYFSSTEVKLGGTKIVVEVCFLLRPHLEMKKRTHLWAKIATASCAEELSHDLCS